jgi:hypothetical protein
MFASPKLCRTLAVRAVCVAGVLLVSAAPAAGAVCSARSGPQTTALVELYTSEGCSSCPPAERWLSGAFPVGTAVAPAIALAFHVDYWDRLGWKDRFAAPAHTERQYAAMRANHARFVYTPQVLVQGRDFPEWRASGGAAALATATAGPARAEIALDAALREGSIAVAATARVPAPGDRRGATLYVALSGSGLASDVKAGENAGVRLVHDHVVRVFRRGPAADARGELRWEVDLPMPAEAGRAMSVVAFVQGTESGAVLQALALPLTAACARLR